MGVLFGARHFHPAGSVAGLTQDGVQGAILPAMIIGREPMKSRVAAEVVVLAIEGGREGFVDSGFAKGGGESHGCILSEVQGKVKGKVR